MTLKWWKSKLHLKAVSFVGTPSKIQNTLTLHGSRYWSKTSFCPPISLVIVITNNRPGFLNWVCQKSCGRSLTLKQRELIRLGKDNFSRLEFYVVILRCSLFRTILHVISFTFFQTAKSIPGFLIVGTKQKYRSEQNIIVTCALFTALWFSNRPFSKYQILSLIVRQWGQKQ